MKFLKFTIVISLLILSNVFGKNKLSVGFSTGTSISNNIGLCSCIYTEYSLFSMMSIKLNLRHHLQKGFKREISLLPTLSYNFSRILYSPYLEIGIGHSHYPESKGIYQKDGIDTIFYRGGGYGTCFIVGAGMKIPIRESLSITISSDIFHSSVSQEQINLSIGLQYIL